MIPYERQERILQILKEQKMMKINDLHVLLPNMSMSTLKT